jgi:Spy/CpxP family protein refolding chaperone
MRVRVRAKLALLGAGLVVAAAGLVAGCGEEADPAPAPAAAPKPLTNLEEPAQPPAYVENPGSAFEQAPISDPEERLHHWEQWWHHAREVLFSGIDLNAEQARQIDAAIDAELERGADLQQRNSELKAARAAGDRSRFRAARRALTESRAKVKETHEVYEELRALLTREQWPAFDMNRARLVAESQSGGQEHANRVE